MTRKPPRSIISGGGQMAAKKGASRQLAEALKRAGSQAELARQLGVSASTVRRWAQRGLPSDRAPQLSAWLDVARAAAKQRPRKDRPQALLREALKRSKSAAALARELGVSPSTVRGWVKRGRPTPAGLAALLRLREVRQAYRVAENAERKRLEELMGFAGQLDVLPLFFDLSEVRSGERTKGWQYAKKWNRELSQGFIAELEKWVESLRRRYTFWQGVVRMMHFEPTGSREFKKSGPNIIYQLRTDDGAQDLLIDATLTTVRVRSARQLAGEFRGTLEDVMEQGFYAYIVGVTVFNYRMRTDEERRAWVRSKKSGVVAKARAEKAERKRKRIEAEKKRRARQPKALPSPSGKMIPKALPPKS